MQLPYSITTKIGCVNSVVITISHLGACSCYYVLHHWFAYMPRRKVDHTDCLHHTAEMAVVEPIWQLHTLIVMNSCYYCLLWYIPSSSIYRWQGVGLSVHGPFRVATENTLFAMPETFIGNLRKSLVNHCLLSVGEGGLPACRRPAPPPSQTILCVQQHWKPTVQSFDCKTWLP